MDRFRPDSRRGVLEQALDQLDVNQFREAIVFPAGELRGGAQTLDSLEGRGRMHALD